MNSTIAESFGSLFAQIHAEVDPIIQARANALALHHGNFEDSKPYRGRPTFNGRIRLGCGNADARERQRSSANAKPLADELPLKEFVARRAKLSGKSWQLEYNRLYQSGFAGLKLRRVNQRVVFVKL